MSDRSQQANLTLWEGIGFVYVTGPLALFLATFIRLDFALPGLVLIAWSWLGLGRDVRPASQDLRGLLAVCLCALGWVFLSGIIPPLGQNYDWWKHYAVFTELIDRPWPPAADGESLRYAIGFYLVPSAFLKVVGKPYLDIVVGSWCVLGVMITLKLLVDRIGLYRSALLQIAVFALFSGADIIGTAITQHQSGPFLHLEWWSGWGTLPSNTTSLFWTPQHVICSWITVALILRQQSNFYIERNLGILTVAVTLWSPFAAIGLLPILIVVTLRESPFRILTIENISSVILAMPIALYLSAETAAIPRAMIWNAPNFKWWTLPVFILIETTLICIAIWRTRPRERDLLIASAITLATLPLVFFGVSNDLLMRGSLPALTVLSILSAEAFATKPIRKTWPLIVLLIAGLATPIGEIVRGFYAYRLTGQMIDFPLALKGIEGLRSQYFAPEPLWILHNP